MGNGGSKPDPIGPVPPGLFPIRRRIDEIRGRRKLRTSQDSIVSTAELLDHGDSVTDKDAEHGEATDSAQLRAVPESDGEGMAGPAMRRVEAERVEKEFSFADLPKSPSFRHFATVRLPFDSDDSGNEDEGNDDDLATTTDEGEVGTTGNKKKKKEKEKKAKKAKRLRSFARRPVVVFSLLHVPSCYSAQKGNPKCRSEPASPKAAAAALRRAKENDCKKTL